MTLGYWVGHSHGRKGEFFTHQCKTSWRQTQDSGALFVLTACEHCWLQPVLNKLVDLGTLPWSAYWLGCFSFQGTIFPQSWGSISHLALCNYSSITALCNAKQTFLTSLLNLSYYSTHKNYVAHAKAGQLAQRAFVEAPKPLQNLFSVMSKSCMCKQCCRQKVSEVRAKGCTEKHLLLN